MHTFFVQKPFARLFSNYSLALYFFFRKNIGTKDAPKMMMNLTAGVIVTNMFMSSFYAQRFQTVQKGSQVISVFWQESC